MDNRDLAKLKILHIGTNPEFVSNFVFENIHVEISSADNPFTASQWISVNGLPDGIICERKLPGSNGFGFQSINERIRLMEGKSNLTSNPGKGTRWEFEVPLT